MDIKQLNQLLEQYLMQSSPIADKYGGCWYVKSGSKVGNYTIIDSKNWDLIISGQVNQFLLEVSRMGGYGNVTSIMEGNHKGNTTNPRSHKSGNKLDLGLGDCRNNVTEIIKRIIPILTHKACIEAHLEAIPKIIADKVKLLVLNNETIKNRIKSKQLIFEDWGTMYSPYAHLDIQINPDYLTTIPKAKN